MSSDWTTVPLGEASDVFTGFPFKGDAYLPRHAGIRVVRGDNVTEHTLRWGEKEKCWAAITDDLIPFRLKVGDVVIGMDGSKVGKNFAAVTPVDGECLLAQRVARVRAKPHFDQTYLRYSICNQMFTEYVQAVHTGTSIPHISKGQIERFRIFSPPLNHQREIAALLGALDDRIALLRETNATLEAIAQALFKSWFVDFDPVHAKSQGRAPAGMDEATAALFPDSFEESALGLVPKGWRTATVESLMDLAYGKALKATDRVPGAVPVYGSGGITGYHDKPLIDGPSVIVGRKGTVGSLYWEDRALFPIDTVFYVKAKAPLTFCFYQLGRLGLEGMNTDGAVPGLNRSNVYRLPVLLPRNDLLSSFDELIRSLRRRISLNAKQTQTLATLRDTLLPRLISGQLRLPEAEAIIESH
jgi:type I restriction enzyme S subunit